MTPFPSYQPQNLSLGPLEAEIVEILWLLGPTSATAIHQHILEDIERELTYSSVSTVLKRLTKKGWVSCDRQNRIHIWKALVSRRSAEILKAHQQLHQFLAVGSPEIVAAFADTLDDHSLDQLDAIAQKVKAARIARDQSSQNQLSQDQQQDPQQGGQQQ
ncbi:BlaI/MecI/CopY family transcriptional regulator [cf. Phormidesmis sp. LEGE 11477]|uniref:BlaI/MecI/CopY family transcriptional regulator n=1 Tax=cf. Phormidesmis sp. LEGE 11477 TaxID=1828680 RepID=UPI001880E523|nr:BlaI/MecI/CopY family transcriptional regulator [cf. Phormidesmis sp. LEGE 11477]MBE9060661.1 BlaI/MecI/CopY family transcriptional regulator [cf. Phormidesmis sp. LEGE 11477]